MPLHFFLKLSLKHTRIIINLEIDLFHFSTSTQSLVTNLTRIKQLSFLVFCFTLILHFGLFSAYGLFLTVLPSCTTYTAIFLGRWDLPGALGGLLCAASLTSCISSSGTYSSREAWQIILLAQPLLSWCVLIPQWIQSCRSHSQCSRGAQGHAPAHSLFQHNTLGETSFKQFLGHLLSLLKKPGSQGLLFLPACLKLQSSARGQTDWNCGAGQSQPP